MAYVQSVNNDYTVNIEEYNFSSNCSTMGSYSYRENKKADWYIHIRDGNGGATIINSFYPVSVKNIIYPNPTKSFIKIDYNSNDYKLSYTIFIYDYMWKIVYSEVSFQKIMQVDLSFLKTGLYIVAIENKGKFEKYKIVKE